MQVASLLLHGTGTSYGILVCEYLFNESKFESLIYELKSKVHLSDIAA